MVKELHIAGYRSLRDLRLRLGPVTVVEGANGVGKSNLYRALRLVSALAAGRFAEAISAEGGMPSALWSGNSDHPRVTRLTLGLEGDDFSYEVEVGLMPSEPRDPFRLDPDIKAETLEAGGRGVAKRKGASWKVVGASGRWEERLGLSGTESMLSALVDGAGQPVLTHAARTLARWRCYDAMRTDPAAPARQPMRGYWCPVLAENGGNLAAVLRTVMSSDQRDRLQAAVKEALPECQVEVETDGMFQVAFHRPGLNRALHGHELSDGTLRFLCLAAALCSPSLPALMVLNEPETSLNEEVLPALAGLIQDAAQSCQLLVVTHSERLGSELAERCGAKRRRLVMRHGESRLAGQEAARRSYVFDEED
jgi:predicted ATPase